MDEQSYDHAVPRRSAMTHQQLREQLPWPSGRPFKILSIDGGGILGVLPASVLAELEERFLGRQPIGQHFDMIAGTSTGGIIALGLASGLSAQEIRNFYLERGRYVFPQSNWLGRRWQGVRHAFASRHHSRQLEAELRRILKDCRFGDARNRLCIPSFDGRYGEPWVFKTPHHPDYRKDKFERMVDVGLATSAAPTYLPGFFHNGYTMLDGGIWANNPVMIALVDALSCLQLERRQIQILSLGCGQRTFRVGTRLAHAGWLMWSRPALKAAMRAQSHNALGQAGLLIGKDHLRRLDTAEKSDLMALDDVNSACEKLPAEARALVEASGHDINELFLRTLGTPMEDVVG